MCEDLNEIWLTTDDNPFDPFTQFDRWMQWDCACGYDTCGKIARLCGSTNNLTPHEERQRIDHAIYDLCNDAFVVRADGAGISKYHLVKKGETTAF